MKIQLFIQSATCLLFIGVLASGCGGSQNDAEAHGEEHAVSEHAEEGILFSATKGLSVPKNTADFIGLKIVDVEEQKMASTLRFSAKVYQPSATGKPTAESRPALASGFLRKADAERLKVGQSVKMEAKDSALTGKVVALNRQMEKANGQVEVLIEIDDPQKSLAMGNYVEALVPIGNDKTVIGIPRTALLRTAEGNFVYTVSGEHLVRSEVKVGDVSNEVVEIKDGLYAGDQIVANPVMTLWMAELQSIRGGAACADGH